ncbi:MAG: hypothetical protein IJF97_01720 [Eggerthellaceae bacterium]|nr:hypothetical protein [Eggerthellaceae bacterium]
MSEQETDGLDPDRARKIAEECYGDGLAHCRRHAPAGHDAADLAQETFLRFVRALARMPACSTTPGSQRTPQHSTVPTISRKGPLASTICRTTRLSPGTASSSGSRRWPWSPTATTTRSLARSIAQTRGRRAYKRARSQGWTPHCPMVSTTISPTATPRCPTGTASSTRFSGQLNLATQAPGRTLWIGRASLPSQSWRCASLFRVCSRENTRTAPPL